jgi:hypothetical protein
MRFHRANEFLVMQPKLRRTLPSNQASTTHAPPQWINDSGVCCPCRRLPRRLQTLRKRALRLPLESELSDRPFPFSSRIMPMDIARGQSRLHFSATGARRSLTFRRDEADRAQDRGRISSRCHHVGLRSFGGRGEACNAPRRGNGLTPCAAVYDGHNSDTIGRLIGMQEIVRVV